MTYELRTLGMTDAEALLDLYRTVASASETMGRDADEYDPAEVREGLERVGPAATSIGAFADGVLCGEIHARRLKARRFRHVITGLSVAVHPDHQGRGLGRRLFEALFAWTGTLEPPVTRIELILLATNCGALRLYERLGFEEEGRMRARVRFPDERIEDDILMAWLAPGLRDDRGGTTTEDGI